jgi:hypothetical protein
MHLKLPEVEKEIFDGLHIHYRVVENASGDLDAATYRTGGLDACPRPLWRGDQCQLIARIIRRAVQDAHAFGEHKQIAQLRSYAPKFGLQKELNS